MSTRMKSSGLWSAFLVIAALATWHEHPAHAEGAPPAPDAGRPSVQAGSAAQTHAEIAGPGEGDAFLAQSATTAQDFRFTDLLGRERALAQARGRVTLLEFWASWCVPCRKGFPFLDELQRRYAGAGLAVVAVTLEEDGVAVREFTERHPASFLVGRDPSGRAGELFEVGAIPTALLLDSDGRVLGRFEGGTNAVHRQIEEAVDTAMRGDPLQASGASARAKSAPTNALAWQREYLADPIMNLNGDVLTRSMREHVHASKEGAAGSGGIAGGGCGCN